MLDKPVMNSVASKIVWWMGTFVAIVALYNLAYAIYNLYFHPLRHFPGPKLPAAFPIIHNILRCSGNMDRQTLKYHNQYGDIVRMSDDWLSFSSARAWKDIYGHIHPQFPKPGTDIANGPGPDIILSNDADHARYRKSLSHAFSEKGLRDQEPLIRSYIDVLIAKLKGRAERGEATDLVKWYNLTTFDLIGDLAFGESFNGLETEAQHEWVASLFGFIKMVPFLMVGLRYPLLKKLLMTFLPKSTTDAIKKHRGFAATTTMKRVTSTALHGRGDFMDAMPKHRGEKDGLSDDELASNAAVLIIGGSETTASLLSGVTYWRLKTPHAMERVTKEVRGAFNRDEDIDFRTATAKLPYMLACLEGGLRIYPPVPSGLARLSPGATVDGHYIPKGTTVNIPQFAATNCERNFHDPAHFHPERWLLPLEPESKFYKDNREVRQSFSLGPRNCIGRTLAYEEMRLILAKMLWNFDLELCPQSNGWAESQKTFLIWDKPPLMCLLTKRPRT